MDLVDGAVAIDVEDDAGEGGWEFLFQAAGDFSFELGLHFGRDSVEGGDAGLDDVAGAVLRADADGERGAEVEETVVLAVGGGAVGRAVGMAPGALAVFGFEFVVDFVEDLLEAGFPAFESGFGHFLDRINRIFQDLQDGRPKQENRKHRKTCLWRRQFRQDEQDLQDGANSRDGVGGKTGNMF